jgi:hypothetical protein
MRYASRDRFTAVESALPTARRSRWYRDENLMRHYNDVQALGKRARNITPAAL